MMFLYPAAHLGILGVPLLKYPPQPSSSATPIFPCPGPAVFLQHTCVDFSWVDLGVRTEKSLWIKNKSECTAYFQFAIDCQESVFSIQPAFGTLEGKARQLLRCAFQPLEPFIYFRRVACVIHHQVAHPPWILDTSGDDWILSPGFYLQFQKNWFVEGRGREVAVEWGQHC